jgi:AraC-like DNA-binding protein
VPDPNGTIVASVASAVIDAACERGAARGPLESIVGPLGDPTSRIPFRAFLAMWEHAMRETRYDGLPMLVARGASLERFGLAGYALYVSRTVGDALRRLARFHDLLTDSGRWSITTDGTHAVLAWDRAGDRTLGMRVANEQILAVALSIIEKLLGALPLIEVRLRHSAPRDLTAHERLFRAPLLFDQEMDAVVMPAHLLEQRSPGFDPHLEQFLVSEANAALARIGANDRTSALVSREVLDMLADGIPTAQRVAERLGMSERTLRRRLSEEQRSFDELVSALQRDRAETMLRAGRSVAEVALATGFSESSSFARAYKRWTGKSPGQVRKG